MAKWLKQYFGMQVVMCSLPNMPLTGLPLLTYKARARDCDSSTCVC